MRTRHASVSEYTGGMRGAASREVVAVQSRPGVLDALMLNIANGPGWLVLAMVRHPVLTGMAALLWLTGWYAGWPAALAVAAAIGLGLIAWRQLHRASFRRVVTSSWRAALIYRHCWQPAMQTCGLSIDLGGREYLPKLRKVVATACVDRVLVDLLSGQCPEDFEAVTSQLAHTFEAWSVRVKVDRPGRIWLEFTHTDPLGDIVSALDPPNVPDLTALPVGVTEAGSAWTVRLLGAHLLVAGATGSGKGSVLWSQVRARGPSIRDGSLAVWAMDPKGGMEPTPGAELFARFAYQSATDMVELLEEAVAYMRERAERLRKAGHRTHIPTAADPVVLVLVDELAALTAYAGDRELKKRAEAALQLLLSQGRAPGVLVVAAVQDPGKDVIGFRDLFPTRIALRLLEDVQVDMVLGRSARQHGAECDRIPASLPGVGYVVLDGIREPVRVRAAYISDDDLGAMVDVYRPGSKASDRPPLTVVEDSTA